MKDPANSVYGAIYTALSGNVTVGATTLPVYNFMPEEVENGYVYIDDFLASNEDLKDRFMHFGNINIQVIIPTSDPAGSRLSLNQFCNVALNLIKPQVNSTLDLTPDFNNTYLYTNNLAEFTDNFDDGRTIRRVIRLTLGIEEL